MTSDDSMWSSSVEFDIHLAALNRLKFMRGSPSVDDGDDGDGGGGGGGRMT